MTSGSINDFVNRQLVPAMLEKIKIPACILKIDGSLISVYEANDKFVNLSCADASLPSVCMLRDIYPKREIPSAIKTGILKVAANKKKSKEAIQLNLSQDFQALQYDVENTYLFSQDNSAFVLHTLDMQSSEGVKESCVLNSPRTSGEKLVHTSETFIILDKELVILEISLQSQIFIQEYFGLHLEKGKSILSYNQESDLASARKRYTKVLKGQTEYSELSIPRSDGTTEKISITYKPVLSTAGMVTGVCIAVDNVTEKTDMNNTFQAQDIDLSMIYNHLSEMVFLISVEDHNRFRFASVNKAFLKNTGLSETAVIGHLVEEVIPEPYLQAALTQYRQAFTTKEPVTREEVAEYPSGRKHSVITVSPYFDATGNCIKIIGSIQDITDRVIAEKKVYENSNKIQAILDSSPDIICTLDKKGILYSISAASERLLGYLPDSLIHRPLLDLVANKYHKSTREFLQKVIQGEDTTYFENELIHKYGSILPVIWSAHWNPSEKRIYCTVRDATEKRIAEQMLIDSEKRFKALVHDGSDMIAILDDFANYLYVSPSSKSVLDFEPEMFIGRKAFEFIHPEDIEKARLEFTTAAGQEKVSLSPFRFRHNNGTWRWVQTILTDLRKTPSINGFVANSRDVTAIVEGQKNLEASNERYHYVSRATSDAIWDHDVASGSLLWGNGFLKMFGYREDMTDSNIQAWKSRVHPDDVDRVKKKLNAFFKSGNTNWKDEYRFIKADGNYAYVADKGFVIRNEEGTPVRMIGAMQDITSRKKEEARLRVLESVVTNTIDAVIIAKIWPSGEHITKIIFVNTAFEQMTGYRAAEVEGRSPWFLQGSGSDRLELEKLINSIQNNMPYQGTIINYKKNGDEIWVSYSVTPVADSEGIHTHWIAILRDVTEAKNRELKQALLTDFNDIFKEEKGLQETVISVLSKVSEFGNFGFAALWTNDNFSGKLELTASQFFQHHEQKHIRDVKSSSIGKHYALQVKNNKQQGCWEITDTNDELAKNDIIQLWGIPLYHYKTLIGVLLLGKTKDSTIAVSKLPDNLGNHLAAELHRKKIEQDLSHIFNLAPDIIAITDFSGNFKKLNPAASKLLGYSIDELLSRPFRDFLHPEEKLLKLEQLSKLRESGKSYYIEERYLTAEGRSKWLAWTSQPLEHEKLVYSVAKDITEKKELEELLLNSNSIARIGSWELTLPERKVSWSPITCEIMQADLDYIPATEKPLGEFYPQNAMDIINSSMKAAEDFGTPWDQVLQIKTISGGLKWVRSIGSAELIDGKCLRLFGSLQDIDLQVQTEISAKQARAELEESEKRYSELFHLSPLPMWVYDFETLGFLDVNQTAISSYGYNRKEFLSMTIKDIRPEEEMRQLEETLVKTRNLESNFFQGTFKHRRKNGEIIQVDIKSNTIIYKGRKAKIIIANDITERLKQFHAIEARNERLREVAWVQSHKVRAPLARLMGLVQMLSGKATEDPSIKKILDYIDSSAEELDQVVREVVSKSEELDKSDI